METVHPSRLSKSGLATLNQCQVYMRATYLLDICNATGNKIEQYIWNQPTVVESNYHQWPTVPKIPHECGVSDGSLQNQHDTYVWIVEDTSSTDWIAGLKPRQQWQPQLILQQDCQPV